MIRARHTVTALAASLLCLTSTVGIAAGLPPQAAGTTPEAMIEQTTAQVLDSLKNDREALQAHPGRIYRLIEKEILPHFDFDHMSRWVLGRYWRNASAQQRSAFEQQFRDLLVNTYGDALLNYSGQTVTYLPTRGDPKSGEVVVRARLHNMDGGPDIPLDYRLNNEKGQWRVVDVSIDGVSLVTNYRETFAGQIQREGLNGLIRHLAEHNKQSAG